MVWWHAAAWGLAGGAATGLASLMTAVINAGFHWPWRGHSEQIGPRLFVFASGLLLGGLVAGATHGSVSGAWPAFALGVGALGTVQGLVSGIQVSERPETPVPVSPSAHGAAVGIREREEPKPELREEGVGDGGR